ncbi:DsbA family protein [Austwickia chelonae]|uniref:DsbA family protein n=1 Tax=Austwickia chelonae TaxID=100225 RepID=UPI000E23B88A|nr:thioredoxin domain-containing protein [Austwickia chelonae]
MAPPQNSRQAKISAAAPAQGKNIKGLLAVIISVVVVAAALFVLFFNGKDEPSTLPDGSSASSGGDIKLPKGVSGKDEPVVATNGGVLKEGVPTLQIFEDFQCPWCQKFDQMFGPKIGELGAAGKINVVYYQKTFLDDSLQNKSSSKAANAALCASDAGKFFQVHEKIFAKQPKEEGKGYSDEDIQKSAVEAGLSGEQLETWKSCVAKETYKPYLKNLETYTSKTLKVSSTPSYYVDRKKIDTSGISNAEEFEKKLFETAK